MQKDAAWHNPEEQVGEGERPLSANDREIMAEKRKASSEMYADFLRDQKEALKKDV